MKGFLRSKSILSLVTVVIIATAVLIALAGNAIHSWAAATDLYVNATTGNDSNSGSQSAPFATINKAASVAQPGTTVHVAPGIYRQPVTTDSSGTATARIIYVSDTTWGAKIQTSGAEMVWDNNGDYVDIIGFEITGTGSSRGIYNYGSHVRSMNNYIHDIPTPGCASGGGITDADYAGSDNDEIGNVIARVGTGSCTQTHGIYHANFGGHIFNNIVSNGSGYGIQMWHAATNVTIANNLVFENQTGGIIVGAGDDPGGITADYTIVANNIIIYNHGNPALLEYGSTGVHNRYLNNILYGNDGGNGDTPYLQNGLTAQATLNADPQFTNYKSDGGGDYHLKPTSPAIDAGTSTGAPATDIDGNPRPQGKGYDIGPYEYGSSSPTPTPTPTTPTPTPQPGGESIALRAAASGNNGTGGSTLSIGLPAGTQRGDVLVALVVVRTAGNTITAPAGWNLVLRQGSSASISTASYVHVAGSSEPASYTWSFGTAGEASGGIASYIGVDTTTPVDADHAQYNRLNSNVDNSGVTTTTANDMLVYAVGITVATTVNVPSGFSQQWQTTSGSSTTSEMSQETYSEIGDTSSIHGTHNGGARSNITHLIALKPAEVAITATPTPTPPASPTPTPTPTTPTPTPQPGGESIALRAAASGNNGTGGSTLTIGLPAGTQRGDVLVALVVVRTAGNTITAPAGWKLVLRQDSNVSISTASYVHVAGSSEPTSYSWSFGTAGEASGGIASYIGVDTTTPVDAAHAQYNRLSSDVDNSGVTTTTANDMLVYAVGVTTATTVNVPSGFSEQWQTTSGSSTTSEMSQQTYSSIGATGSIHGTHNGGDSSNITHLIALKPAGVAAAVTSALTASTQKPIPAADNLPLTASIKQWWV